MKRYLIVVSVVVLGILPLSTLSAKPIECCDVCESMRAVGDGYHCSVV
jgi:hypothetical protein